VYNKLADGGDPISVPDYNSRWVRLLNGWSVGLHNSSQSGGRAIDIRSSTGEQITVHIQP